MKCALHFGIVFFLGFASSAQAGWWHHHHWYVYPGQTYYAMTPTVPIILMPGSTSAPAPAPAPVPAFAPANPSIATSALAEMIVSRLIERLLSASGGNGVASGGSLANSGNGGTGGATGSGSSGPPPGPGNGGSGNSGSSRGGAVGEGGVAIDMSGARNDLDVLKAGASDLQVAVTLQRQGLVLSAIQEDLKNLRAEMKNLGLDKTTTGKLKTEILSDQDFISKLKSALK